MGALGAVLGLVSVFLRVLLGHLGAILRPRKAIESERATMQKTAICFYVFEGIYVLGGFLGSTEGVLEPSWLTDGRRRTLYVTNVWRDVLS